MGIYFCDKNFTVTQKIIRSFDKNGFLILKNFLTHDEIVAIQQQILELSTAINGKYNFLIGEHIDQHLLKLLTQKKIKQSQLYDRLQHIPGILALPSNLKILNLAKQLLRAKYLGIWPRIQLRFDIFGDRWNVINWHNDYMYNRGTESSITFWIPMVHITKKMGPIKLARGSHRQEYIFIQIQNAKFDFTLSQENIDSLDLLEHNEYLPGDICILHSKTIHTGCLNEDQNRARLTCIFRLQDLTKLELNHENER
ncbi:phytanoyl-CoA dioxygenase family protein [Rickettsiella endosymbiont of Rhagonycha lignosa]|uniref:phytanoyl-CoA dioxygenase family protein n=1 Tax=Rickettsiella endosymbiont of Rhagonycha lignosa TaxID=3077937 RepID=UPI00313C9B19